MARCRPCSNLSTPWHRSRFTGGRGTNGANRSSISVGVNTRCVVPSVHGHCRARTTRPSRRPSSRCWPRGGRHRCSRRRPSPDRRSSWRCRRHSPRHRPVYRTASCPRWRCCRWGLRGAARSHSFAGFHRAVAAGAGQRQPTACQRRGDIVGAGVEHRLILARGQVRRGPCPVSSAVARTGQRSSPSHWSRCRACRRP